MSTDNIRRVVDRWTAEQTTLLPAMPSTEVQTLLLRAQLCISEDVRFLYSLCGGMPEGVVDSNWFELWPLTRVINESVRFPAPFVPFAEGFLSAQIYCVKIENASVASVYIDYSYCGTSPELLAPTLDAAFALLLSNPKALHLP